MQGDAFKHKLHSQLRGVVISIHNKTIELKSSSLPLKTPSVAR